MGTREILSLQFGHYSNFVGTHWWNIQETGFEYDTTEPSEINHDVLFREGLTYKGQVTYTPRLLLVDLKGSLGSLPEQGQLYEPLVDPTSLKTYLDNNVDIQSSTSEPKNQFQQELNKTSNARELLNKSFKLDDDVKVWSDFLYSQFHPRTVNVVSEYTHNSSCFDAFTQGTGLWQTEQFIETFSDKIRNYIEECDSFQGFHVTLDSVNGFSGLGSSCMRYIEDEYEKKPIIAFPVIPSHYDNRDKGVSDGSPFPDAFRVMNLAFCFDALNEHSSLFVPLCTGSTGWRQPGIKRTFNRVLYEHSSYYHTSAILAAALDTLTLKYRTKTCHYSLKDLCADFCNNSRKVAAASLCLPFSINEGSDFIDCLDKWDGPLTKSITPSCSIGTDKLVQMFTLRGVPETRLKRPLSENNPQRTMSAYNCKTVNEMFNFYLSCNYFCCLSSVTNVAKGMSVRTPFPQFFDDSIGSNGNVCATPRQTNLEFIPVLAGLHSGSSISSMIESLHSETKRVKPLELRQFARTGLEIQEISECFENLLELKECYEENYI